MFYKKKNFKLAAMLGGMVSTGRSLNLLPTERLWVLSVRHCCTTVRKLFTLLWSVTKQH